MRYICIACLTITFLSGTAVADWKAEIVPMGINNRDGDRSVLIYSADAERGTHSIGLALEGLAKSGHIAILQTLTIHDLVNDETFQKELANSVQLPGLWEISNLS
jgi:hypothetical protein